MKKTVRPVPKTKEQFIQEFIDYYGSHPERRSVDSEQRCSYLPAHENTEGCAIGRYLTEEICKKIEGKSITACFYTCPSLEHLGFKFLKEMQILHDWEFYWDEKGLSELGQQNLQSIKNNYL